jgi:DNA-binding transcriptional LysR family regulator
MNLDRLAHFLHIVDAGSLSAASRTAHLSQPALSRNLHLLEEELGVLLFERSGRALVLTAAGRALAPRARALLAAVARMGREVGRCAERDYYDLRLGAVDSVATYLLPEAMDRLRAAFPELAIKLTVRRTAPLLDGLRSGALDLAVVAHSGTPSELRASLLGRYVLQYYGRRDRFAALARARTRADVQAFPVVEIEPAPGAASLIPDGALSYAVASTVASVKALVLAGFGVGDLLDFALAPEERARLVCAAVPLDPHCGLYLAASPRWTGAVEERVESALAAELRHALEAKRAAAPPRARERAAGATRARRRSKGKR